MKGITVKGLQLEEDALIVVRGGASLAMVDGCEFTNITGNAERHSGGDVIRALLVESANLVIKRSRFTNCSSETNSGAVSVALSHAGGIITPGAFSNCAALLSGIDITSSSKQIAQHSTLVCSHTSCSLPRERQTAQVIISL